MLRSWLPFELVSMEAALQPFTAFVVLSSNTRERLRVGVQPLGWFDLPVQAVLPLFPFVP